MQNTANCLWFYFHIIWYFDRLGLVLTHFEFKADLMNLMV